MLRSRPFLIRFGTSFSPVRQTGWMESNGQGSLPAAWDWMMECARSADAAVRGADSWVPPVAEELVLTARASALGQWYPFTSHNYLRFQNGPVSWLPGTHDDVTELAGSISFCLGKSNDLRIRFEPVGAITGPVEQRRSTRHPPPLSRRPVVSAPN